MTIFHLLDIKGFRHIPIGLGFIALLVICRLAFTESHLIDRFFTSLLSAKSHVEVIEKGPEWDTALQGRYKVVDGDLMNNHLTLYIEADSGQKNKLYGNIFSLVPHKKYRVGCPELIDINVSNTTSLQVSVLGKASEFSDICREHLRKASVQLMKDVNLKMLIDRVNND